MLDATLILLFCLRCLSTPPCHYMPTRYADVFAAAASFDFRASLLLLIRDTLRHY